MTENNPYILATGGNAAKRLALLDEIYGPYTHEFLKQIIKPGMSVLDVGCGTGNVSCWLAKQVGETGEVTGIDASVEQLNIAAAKAATLDLKNTKFLNYSVYDLEKIATTFDVVYSRFLLVHLEEPLKALKIMHSLVNREGMLVCDEQCVAASLTYPDSSDFNRSRQLVEQLSKLKNIDFEFGKKLYNIFNEFNFNSISLQVIQPALITSAHKNLWPLFFEESKAAFLQAGIINDADFEKMVAGLKQIVTNKNSYILPMRNFQICGKKS